MKNTGKTILHTVIWFAAVVALSWFLITFVAQRTDVNGTSMVPTLEDGDQLIADKPSMIIFNKIDNYSWIEKEEDDLTPMEKENIPLEDLKNTWMAKLNEDCLFISAKNKENIDEFREVLYKKVRELHVQKYPYNDFLYQDYE